MGEFPPDTSLWQAQKDQQLQLHQQTGPIQTQAPHHTSHTSDLRRTVESCNRGRPNPGPDRGRSKPELRVLMPFSYESPARKCHKRVLLQKSSHSHPDSRFALVFLLVFVFAIAGAILLGFENNYVHTSKQQMTQQFEDQSEKFINGRSLAYDLKSMGKSFVNRSAYAFVESNTPEGTTATVLSRASQLSELISHLDASDVIECYVVTRMAPLANVAGIGGGNKCGGE